MVAVYRMWVHADRWRHCYRTAQRQSSLSGFAKVVGWSECRSVGGMELDVESGEEGFCGLLEPCEVVPPAMARQCAFEVAPEALNEVELRRVGGYGCSWAACARHHSRTARLL